MNAPAELEPVVDQVEELAPITEAQWVRILDGRPFCVLVKPAQQQWAGKRAVKCGGCRYTHMYGDPRRGWCIKHRALVGDTFPKLCRQFEARND